LDKQIHVDTIASFVIQSGQVSECGAISVSRHVTVIETQIGRKHFFIRHRFDMKASGRCFVKVY